MDPELLASFTFEGKLPRSVLIVTADTVYTQCPKALVRSHLWDASRQLPESAIPSSGQMMAALRTVGGGRIDEYIELCEETRAEAFAIMMQHADRLGANAIVGGSPPIAVGAALVYSLVVSFVLVKLVGLVIPLRPSAEDEVSGLDISMHGEEAYLHAEASDMR